MQLKKIAIAAAIVSTVALVGCQKKAEDAAATAASAVVETAPVSMPAETAPVSMPVETMAASAPAVSAS
jgi:hypothetical protein